VSCGAGRRGIEGWNGAGGGVDSIVNEDDAAEMSGKDEKVDGVRPYL
jgi:hypothetical protein